MRKCSYNWDTCTDKWHICFFSQTRAKSQNITPVHANTNSPYEYKTHN